jgi:trigger factor
MDLPDEFLKRWLVASNEGKVNEEEVAKDYQNYAEEMKWNLILNRIAEDNKVEVENEEVVSKAKELIVAQLASSGLGDQMADQLDAFADNYLKGNEGQNYLQVFNQVRNDKIMKLIRDKISITKKEVNLDQFKKEAAK